jgi:hypothetical protein
MPMYEFECERGHITSDLVPIGTRDIVCAPCLKEHPPLARFVPEAHLAKRILSATPTTFEFADCRRKRSFT